MSAHAPRFSASRFARALVALVAVSVAMVAATSQARAFQVDQFSGLIGHQDGTTDSRAGAHPYSVTTTLAFSSLSFFVPDGQVKDFRVDLPPGLIGNPNVTPTLCRTDQLYDGVRFNCPASSQIGLVELLVPVAPGLALPWPGTLPIYNMEPSLGAPARFAFIVFGQPVYLKPQVRSDGDYGLSVEGVDTLQTVSAVGAITAFWGVPADPSHDPQRLCTGSTGDNPSDFGCSVDAPLKPFMTNRANCAAGAATWKVSATSWQEPQVVRSASFDHDTNGEPMAVTECEKVPFKPSIDAGATTDLASTATGLDFRLDVPDTGILNPDGIAQANVKKATVTLPPGMTINPAVAEGLGVCTPADLARETATSDPGAGCPNSSKLGTVDIVTPLLKEHVQGALYIAEQDDPSTPQPGAENPFDSLLAMYIVAKSPERGVIVKAAGRVDPDPVTGQLVTTFDDLPQLPFSSFELHFREGQRAPLASPSACGTYTASADFVPWSAADPDHPAPGEVVHTSSQFEITRGIGGGPCPAGGLPPFKPGLLAGTANNSAGSYSPFSLRLTRNSDEQEFTNFSIKLPPGVSGKLAGIPYCPDTAIAAAKGKTGAAELATPSCPKASEVGSTLVGAGVGSIQTYVPGKVYLAGPYHGSALSIVAITAAKVGPFDVGTVVIREALKVNPETAEVFIDATGSDPIPHIIKGIPVHARDIRVFVDRPDFVVNPTSCRRTSVASTVLGSGLDFASAADDNPVTVTSPFQAASCASLDFKPKLSLSLSGAMKRSKNPALKAVLTMPPGGANIASTSVLLPRSAFIDNAHINNPCTRPQFAAGQCPPSSVLGTATAYTPLLDKPLTGPVYFRANGGERNLPDLVVDLDGQIHITVVGFIDSVKVGKEASRVRTRFLSVPDAPVSKFVLELKGGKKGLIENSRDLCAHTYRASAAFDGQNGKVRDFRPVVRATGCKPHERRR